MAKTRSVGRWLQRLLARMAQYRARKQAAYSSVGRLLTRAVLRHSRCCVPALEAPARTGPAPP